MAKRNEKASLCLLVTMVLAAQAHSAVAAGYGYTPSPAMGIDTVVKEEVENAIKKYPGVGAALVRLIFHDCWVHGCDGSVLLEKTPFSSSYGTEKSASNNIGLGGFDVIDKIKARLPYSSCADIVAFAARDAASYLSGGKITYDVSPGRKDGVVSSAADADNTLPESTFDYDQLKKNFGNKGFTPEELVVLSGAHSVGVAHRSSFQDRLTTAPPAAQTPIDPNYQAALTMDAKLEMLWQWTTNPTEDNNIRDMSSRFQTASRYNAKGVNTAAKGTLDNSYYTANLQNMVLFRSDWELRNDTTGFAGSKLIEYRDNAAEWNSDFSEAMEKLSKLPAEGKFFEIRTNCRRTNKDYYY